MTESMRREWLDDYYAEIGEIMDYYSNLEAVIKHQAEEEDV
jgi:hypothetical protein